MRSLEQTNVTARRSSSKLTPPGSGVPVPGKTDGSRTSRSRVDRFVFELFHNLFQSGKVKAVCFDVGSAPGKFLAIARTDAKLEDLSVSSQFPAASEDAGMGEFDTEIIIPQISVSVKVDDVDVREFFKNSAESAEGY